MPRPLRIEYEGALYHVINRGAGKRETFKSDLHRKWFLELLKDIYETFGVETHSYCLMSNHYHLLVRTPNANLGRAMRHLNAVYTQRFNLNEGTDGALFRGRYKAILIEDKEEGDNYLLNVSFYIHLNPVAAFMVKTPGEYYWSSYRDYLAPWAKPYWLITKDIFAALRCADPVKEYQLRNEAGVDEKFKDFYGKKQLSPIMGSKKFIEEKLKDLKEDKIEASRPDVMRVKEVPAISRVIQAVEEHYELKADDLTKTSRLRKNSEPRRLAIYICRKPFGHSYPEIAAYFSGISKSAVGKSIKTCELALENSSNLRKGLSVILRGLAKGSSAESKPNKMT